MKIFEGKNVPIKSWCNNPEQGAIDQAVKLSALPFIFKHVALMPDTHQGYGMPIGGVIATDNVIIPNAVGVDIGCGMCAVRTSLTDITIDQLKSVLGRIRDSIPVGFNKHNKDQRWDGFNSVPAIPVIEKEIDNAKKQLGTLGGGNHFIEIQKGDDGHIWIMIHSGSRKLGYQIAKEYNEKAQNLCKLWHSDIPEYKGQDGLAFLPIGSVEAKEYLKAMNYALKYALANRKHMMYSVIQQFIFAGLFDNDFVGLAQTRDSFINIHHNYASLENHYGRNVWVHRKGATSAKNGEIGIIPSSQGTPSYIVSGKGNRESFTSCSHGAGRTMSRSRARKELDLEKEQKMLNDQGILHAVRNGNNLDEAPSSYKDIDIVMEEQKDLVSIVTKLTPLAVVKG